jgi:hypothetical protein
VSSQLLAVPKFGRVEGMAEPRKQLKTTGIRLAEDGLS